MLNTNSVKLLTPAQTAELLQIDIRTLAVWRTTRRHKELKFIKLGNRVRYRFTDVVEFIDAQTRH